MKLTALEIERSRRITEREAMENRMAMLEERLTDIANEQIELNELLAKAGHPSHPGGSISSSETKSAKPDAGGLRY